MGGTHCPPMPPSLACDRRYACGSMPENLRALIGKTEEKRSLGTKDAVEAKRRYPSGTGRNSGAMGEPKEGATSLTELEAHALARPVFEKWRAIHRDNPSEQQFWNPDLYEDFGTRIPGYQMNR